MPDSVALLHGDGEPVHDPDVVALAVADAEEAPLTLNVAVLDAECVPEGLLDADVVPVTVDVAPVLPV